ncbi:hypothetical protein [Actinomadura sp. 21ATH]|uniref:hypothetical protein n=1 Tax=Actinomadura sp. 21ATH TaxID=1735444 RepID=UPI0035BFA398
MSTFGTEMRALMAEQSLSLRKLARDVHYTDGYLSRISRDVRIPSADVAQAVDAALKAGGRLIALAQAAQDSADQAGSVEGEEHPTREDDDEMHRRRLLQALATLGAASSPAADALQQIRGGVDRAIGRDEGSHLEEWEETVAEYGYSYLLLPPHRLLRDLAADLVIVQQAASRHAGGRLYPAWCRVTSGLSMLMAKSLCNAGQSRLAREWWSTAQHAALTSGDIDLSLWVTGERLVHGLYEQRPTAILLRRADEALAHSTGAPGRGMAQVRTVRAQLFALQGDVTAAAAELRASETVLQRLPGSVTRDVRSVAGWAEDRIRYTEAWVHAHTGDRDRLDAAVERARQVLPADDPRVRAQLSLLRAAGHVRAGDATEGVRHAHTVYEAQPADHRTAMVTSLARQVMDAVPEAGRSEPVVAAYGELLAAGAPRSIT